MYGQFINDIINFLIVAIVMFFLARYALKLFNSLEPPASPPTGEEVLLTEIRDLLKAKYKRILNTKRAVRQIKKLSVGLPFINI